MTRLLKILLALIGVVLLALAGIAVAVFLIFDPEDYRGVVADLVKAQTGRTLEINGKFGLSFVPCCGVAVEQLRLSNRPDFVGEEFLSVDSVEVGLKLMPLILRRQIVIGNVKVEGLDLNLVQRADGEANWTFESPAADGAAKPTPSTDDEAAAMALPTIAGLRIDDSRVTYRDEQSGANYRLENFSLASDGLRVRQLMNIDTTFRLTDVATATTLQGSAQSQAILDPDAMRLTLVNLRGDIDADGSDLPGGGVSAALRTAEIIYEVESGDGSIDKLSADLKLAGVDMNVAADGKFAAGGLNLSGALDLKPFSPRAALRNLGQPPIDTADPAVLKNLQGKARWSLRGDRLDVSSINMRLDDTNVTGTAQMNYAKMSAIRFDLDLDDIDLDRYVAPAPDAEPAAAAEPAANGEDLPTDTLRTLDLDGRARVGRIKVNGLHMENLVVAIKAANGLIRIDPATADLYGGRYAGVIKLDVTGPTPKATVDQSISTVQAKGLIADLAEVANIEGLLEARVNATGAGMSADEIIQSLAGSVTFDLADGLYRGVDIWHEIRKARAMIRGQAPPAAPADPQTPISALGFTGRMADGKLISERMSGEIPFIKLSGNGVLDMVQQSMDYRFRANVFETPVFDDGQDLSGLKNVTIPLTLTGALASPSVGVDLAELMKDEAVRKLQDRLLDKLGLGQPAPAQAPAVKEPAADAPAPKTPATGTPAGEEPATENKPADPQPPAEAPPEDPRDALKKGLRDLF